MLDAAESYLINLSDVIPDHTRRQWEASIIDAENKRVTDPAAMDILGARSHHNRHTTSGATHSLASPLEDAIRLALSIEEKQ